MKSKSSAVLPTSVTSVDKPVCAGHIQGCFSKAPPSIILMAIISGLVRYFTEDKRLCAKNYARPSRQLNSRDSEMRVLTAGDSNFYHCLVGLAQSVRQHYDKPLIIYDLGLTEQQKKEIDAEIKTINVEVNYSSYITCKNVAFPKNTHKPFCVKHYFENNSEPLIYVDADCLFLKKVELDGFDVGVTVKPRKKVDRKNFVNGIINAGVIFFPQYPEKLIERWIQGCLKPDVTDQSVLAEILSETIDWKKYNYVYDWYGYKVKTLRIEDYNDYYLKTGRIYHLKGYAHQKEFYKCLIEALQKGESPAGILKKLKKRRPVSIRVKADWQQYLHDLRKQESDEIFHKCSLSVFNNGLELGAGDGFMSSILAGYTKNLLCTEINPERLKKSELSNVQYMILDAEQVGQVLKGRSFDFIFSSNLLEHLPDVNNALKGIHGILDDNGVAVHVLPNRLWKAVTILCYIPNKIIMAIDKFFAGNLFKRRPGHKFGEPYKEKYGGNNPKIGRKKQSRLTKLFLPPVHGVSGNTLQELYVFGKKNWIRRFETAGFEVIAIKQVAFSSGYGFGFKRLKRLMERLGVKTASVFILCKKGYKSKYEYLWTD